MLSNKSIPFLCESLVSSTIGGELRILVYYRSLFLRGNLFLFFPAPFPSPPCSLCLSSFVDSLRTDLLPANNMTFFAYFPCAGRRLSPTPLFFFMILFPNRPYLELVLTDRTRHSGKSVLKLTKLPPSFNKPAIIYPLLRLQIGLSKSLVHLPFLFFWRKPIPSQSFYCPPC